MIDRLYFEHVPKGAKIALKCGGCGSQTLTAKKTGTVTFKKFANKALKAGAKLRWRSRWRGGASGKYRYGATGHLPRLDGQGGRADDRARQVHQRQDEEDREV